jgi:phage tail-like protein
MQNITTTISNIYKSIKENLMSNYPLTTNHFTVDWGDTRVGLTQVLGLSIGVESINYREGASPEYSPQKLPGQLKYKNIVLKRGIKKGDNEFYNWLNTISHNTIERRDLMISLLNEEHLPVVTWKLRDAFPVKIEWSDLDSNANEPAIESIEVAYEKMVVENG